MSPAPLDLPDAGPHDAPGVPPRRRIACLTLGQSPRGDVVPDILAQLPIELDVVEFGALDGASPREIAALAPAPGETSLVTRLRDGTDVVLSSPRMARRLEAMCRGIDASRFDLLLVLTTGLFRDFESPCPMVNAQRAMDAAIAAVAAGGEPVGVVYPLARQVPEHRSYALPGCELRLSHGGSGDAADLQRAADDLRGCAMVVLNSVGFTEADRAVVAARTGRPVILARRIVAGAMRLLLDPGGTRFAAPALPAAAPGTPTPAACEAQQVQQRIQGLTVRERQVMSLVAEGLSNKAIGRQLDISPRTVEIHRANMMEKMQAPSAAALIRMVVAAQHPGL